MANSTTRPTLLDFTALLLVTLGFTDDEFVSLLYEPPQPPHTAVMSPADAIAAVPRLPEDVNIYFGVNPTAGPTRANTGRGAEVGVTRLAALVCDLDVKPGGCATVGVAHQIIDNLSAILDTRPSVIVDSGHGLHAYWPVEGGTIGEQFTTGQARGLLRRWGRLVAAVAAKHQARADSVFDLARMLRVPGTRNCKSAGNGAEPLPVIAYLDTGGPLAVAEIDERLTEVGVCPEAEDGAAETISEPETWAWAERTCGYVAALIDGLPSDGPPHGGGRHPWLCRQSVRLACACRLGCVTEADLRRARELLEARFITLLAGEPRRAPGRFEVAAAWRFGVERVSVKTEEQVRAELGGHTHDTENPNAEVGDHDEDGAARVIHGGHLGMAVKLAHQFGGKLLYVHKQGWHRWDGKRWAPDAEPAARRGVHTVLKRDRAKAEKLPAEERDKRFRQIARYETASAISGILTEASVLAAFSAEIADMDADPWLLNTANGTLDLRTETLHGHDPADRITKVTRAAHHPSMVGTAWPQFLTEVLPDQEVRGYFQRLIGLSLLGEVNGDKQVMPIPYGGGANGKSTAIEAISFALGDYAAPAERHLLMAKRADTHPTGIADLRGRRLVTAVETERGSRFDIAAVKWLTGGDTLKGRFLFRDNFEFQPSHLLLLATNHLPVIEDSTEAAWRRIRVLPFTVEIPKADRNPRLCDELQAEADAVLTWIVDGWTAYRRDGLGEPDAVLLATDDYKADSDSVGRFIADECDTGGALSSARTRELYARWEAWAKRNGADPLSMIAFGRTLDSKGYPADKSTRELRRQRISLKPAENEMG